MPALLAGILVAILGAIVGAVVTWYLQRQGAETMSTESASEIAGNLVPAFYLAGHGSYSRPRLIELQYWRIRRYREAFGKRYESRFSAPAIFIDFHLPKFGMGNVDLSEVQGFEKLIDAIQAKQHRLVYVDLDDTKQGLTPDYEAGFVREKLEKAGAKVLNAFTDDEDAFKRALKERCGEGARDYEVTDDSDFVCFFPSLASDITGAALRRELQEPEDDESKDLRRINKRIEGLKRLRPYSGGGRPFIEDRLSSEWQKPRKAVW
jgi:hypothetical protein